MAIFRYQAVNANRVAVTGHIEAENVAQAVSQLEADGLDVQSIASAPAEAAAAKAATWTAAPADLRRLTAQALQKGRAIVPAIRALAEEVPTRSRRAELTSVANVIERGNVDEATAALVELPEYWIPLLNAATTAEQPGQLLSSVLTHAERTDELRRQRRQAFVYPLLVAAAVIAVFVLLSFTVLPSFALIFADFGLDLPVATRVTLNLGRWVTSGDALVAGIVIVAAAVIVFALLRSRSAAGRSMLPDWLRLPAARRAMAGQVAGFTADLVEAGVDPTSALQTAACATRRKRLQTAAAEVARSFQTGQPVSPAAARALTASVVHALRVDTPTASQVRLLRELRETLSERSVALFSWSRGLAAPAAVVLVGLMVGFLVLALYMPIISLVQNLLH